MLEWRGRGVPLLVLRLAGIERDAGLGVRVYLSLAELEELDMRAFWG